MKWFIFLILIQTLRVTGLTTIGPHKLQRCTYHKAYKMNGVHCSSLNLHSVPATLKSNIEILDLSTNRIRDLRNNTFLRYTNLKYLYLGDNMIQLIESLTFDPLTQLEALDLSLNALSTIPEPIFNLPSLRKLYISDNILNRLVADLENMEKPFKAPLQYLNIAKCNLNEFPNFGILPELEHLNVSSNNFKSIIPKNMAQLCKLKIIDLSDSFNFNENVCVNKPLINWFIEKEIEAVPELYSIFNPNGEDIRKCNDGTIDTTDEEIYDECKKHIQIKIQEKTAKQTWIIVASCLGGFLVVAVIFLCCMHRRNVKRTKNSAKDEQSFIKNQSIQI